MSTRKPAYGAATTVTITVNGLTNGSYQQSAFVDNSSNLYNEVFLNGKIKTNAAGTTATGTFSVYAYASYDGGTTYTHNASGSNAAFTPDLAASLVPLVTIGGASLANGTTYYWDFHLVAAAGWLYLPQRWGLVVVNNTGATLDATAGNFLNQYQGVNDTFV